MTKKRPVKPYWEMNTQELAAATAEFDQEFIADTFHPLTPEQREIWESARRKRTKGEKPKRPRNRVGPYRERPPCPLGRLGEKNARFPRPIDRTRFASRVSR
jgi:hypothetical protein